MNLTTIFRIKENLKLDKKTLVILRWIAITGQLIAINLVYFLLNLPFPIGFAYGVIITGFITNLYLQFFVNSIQIKDFGKGYISVE